jgi:hypothetical protein
LCVPAVFTPSPASIPRRSRRRRTRRGSRRGW